MVLIEREALENKRMEMPLNPGYVDVVSWEAIQSAPVIDAAPVVHEKWVWREEWDSHPETRSCDLISCGWYCTGCGIELGDYLTKATGHTVILDDDFCKPKLTCCPNCGCKMNGGEDDAKA